MKKWQYTIRNKLKNKERRLYGLRLFFCLFFGVIRGAWVFLYFFFSWRGGHFWGLFCVFSHDLRTCNGFYIANINFNGFILGL